MCVVRRGKRREKGVDLLNLPIENAVTCSQSGELQLMTAPTE